MPIITPPAKVLVTGANGFLGTWIVRMLLQRGYSTRAAVRSASKGDSLRELLASEEGDKIENFEYVVVNDICDQDAFDEAVKGVDAVAHTAAPVTYQFNNLQDLFRPCVDGTLTILRSVLKNGIDVKRVVVTSSTATVWNPKSDPTIFDDNSWNEVSPGIVKEKGMDAGGMHIYFASKTLAERAAWEFYEQHKSQIHWELVGIVPSLVHGPLATDDPVVPSGLTSSIGMLWKMLCTDAPDKFPFDMNNNIVDVRDVAELHIRAMEMPEAGGERFIVSSHTLRWQEICDLVHSLNPPFTGLNKGQPGAGEGVPHPVIYTSDKARRVFGFEFRQARETYQDLFDDFKRRGWEGEAIQ